jgi:hypothetical protein
MKRTLLGVVLGLLTLGSINAAAAADDKKAVDWTAGMSEGTAELKSMGPLAFGPDGILFIADAKSAAIVAVATGDKPAATAAAEPVLASDAAEAKPLKVDAIDQKVAALLGTKADEILINDLAVNPLTHNVYLAVSRGRGPDAVPVLVRVKAGSGELEAVALDKVMFVRAELPDAPVDGVVDDGRRQSNPRQESITDIAFFQDRVIVAGLSNEEFASTLRAVPFPFKTVAGGTSVEIYHGAHGKFETRAPVRTLVPIDIGAEPHVLAAYTCTPLVKFPVQSLEARAKIRGTTIAELGNRNRPLDMVVYEKDGKEYLLLANNNRGVMKIGTAGIETAAPIETPVSGGVQKGLGVETVAGWTGVEQLDLLGKGHALVLRKAGEAGPFTLEALPLP